MCRRLATSSFDASKPPYYPSFLTRVDVRVLLHVALLVETLAAVGARVGPGVRVDQQVRGQRGRALERLAALATHEAPVLGVDGAMLVKADRVAEGLLAHVAGVGARARVRTSHVHFKSVGRGERLAALGAFVRSRRGRGRGGGGQGRGLRRGESGNREDFRQGRAGQEETRVRFEETQVVPVEARVWRGP